MVIVAWAQHGDGLAALSVAQVSLLLRALKFDAFVEQFAQHQVGSVLLLFLLRIQLCDATVYLGSD